MQGMVDHHGNAMDAQAQVESARLAAQAQPETVQ
jgi:hypothetical protein